LAVTLFADTLDREKIDRLFDNLAPFKGKQRLKINLIDRKDTDLSIPVSSKMGLKVSPELIKILEEMKVRFRLN